MDLNIFKILSESFKKDFPNKIKVIMITKNSQHILCNLGWFTLSGNNHWKVSKNVPKKGLMRYYI